MNTRTCAYKDGFVLAVALSRSDVGELLDNRAVVRRLEGLRATPNLPTSALTMYKRDKKIKGQSERIAKVVERKSPTNSNSGFCIGLSFKERYRLYDGLPMIYETNDDVYGEDNWDYLKAIVVCVADTSTEFSEVLEKAQEQLGLDIPFAEDPYWKSPGGFQEVFSFKI